MQVLVAILSVLLLATLGGIAIRAIVVRDPRRTSFLRRRLDLYTLRYGLVAMVALLAACSNPAVGPVAGTSPAGGPVGTSPTPQQGGYMAESVNMGTGGSWVIFLDLESGTAYQAQRDGSNVLTCNGTVTRSGTTLTINTGSQCGPNLLPYGAFAVRDTTYGLQVSVPWSDGTIHAYNFASGKAVSDYNADVSRMHQQITVEQQEAASQLQRQRAAVEAVEQRSCAALGGQVDGYPGPNLDGTRDPANNWCAPGPGRMTKQAVSVSCAGNRLDFDQNGNLYPGQVSIYQSSWPGCYG